MQTATALPLPAPTPSGSSGEIWTRWTYSDRAQAVIRILNQMAKQYQTAIIVVTHDEKIIPTFQRLYNIRDGRTFEEAGEGRALN